MDQRELVDRAKWGDPDGFARLVDPALARLDAAARLILRDPELARDAVQETLIRAGRELLGLRDPDRFDAWLHRLVGDQIDVRPLRIYTLAGGTVADTGPIPRDVPAANPAPGDEFVSAGEGWSFDGAPDGTSLIAFPPRGRATQW